MTRRHDEQHCTNGKNKSQSRKRRKKESQIFPKRVKISVQDDHGEDDDDDDYTSYIRCIMYVFDVNL